MRLSCYNHHDIYWLSIIKTSYFGSPPPPFFKKFHKIHKIDKFIKFHKIFFLDLVPPSKKLQMQTQIQTKTGKMTRIFFHREMITNLTPGWQLVDTLLTIVQVQQLDILTFFQCQRFFMQCEFLLADNCTSVTTWHFDILPMPEVFMQCEFLQVQWPSTF